SESGDRSRTSQARQPAHAGTALKHDKPSFAWPVSWSDWFGGHGSGAERTRTQAYSHGPARNTPTAKERPATFGKPGLDQPTELSFVNTGTPAAQRAITTSTTAPGSSHR